MASDPRNAASERFYRLIWPHRTDVLRTARLLCRDSADADDLTQETLLKAFSALESFQEGTNARAWLLRILRNARIDRIRNASRDAGMVSLDALPEAGVAAQMPVVDDVQAWPNPHEMLNAFSDEQIIEALQELPE